MPVGQGEDCPPPPAPIAGALLLCLSVDGVIAECFEVVVEEAVDFLCGQLADPLNPEGERICSFPFGFGLFGCGKLGEDIVIGKIHIRFLS